MPLSALLAALVLSGAPDAGTSAPFSWDVPGQLALVRVGNKLDRDGLPMVIYAARSKWKLGDLLTHYAKRFEREGFYLPGRVRLPGFDSPRVVALDETKMISFLVYGAPMPDGTTSLILGAADLGHRKLAATSGLPVFPGARHVTTFNVEQATALSFTITASEAELIDFYRSVLPSGGWKERQPGVFIREGRAVKVLAKPSGQELSVMVIDSLDEDAPLSGIAGGSRSP